LGRAAEGWIESVGVGDEWRREGTREVGHEGDRHRGGRWRAKNNVGTSEASGGDWDGRRRGGGEGVG